MARSCSGRTVTSETVRRSTGRGAAGDIGEVGEAGVGEATAVVEDDEDEDDDDEEALEEEASSTNGLARGEIESSEGLGLLRSTSFHKGS